MIITRLSLSDFRCYADASLSAGEGFVILTGDNGAGKTNILEAISLLTPGRGLRGVALSEIARSNGKGGFAISAQLSEDVSLGTGTRADAPERRQVRINGAQASTTALSDWLATVWLTPAMDRIFTDSAGNRRRFLDRLVLALVPGHAVHANRYEAAMRQRNRLLAQDGPADPNWLAALEVQMAEHGEALHSARTDLVAALAGEFAQQVQGPFARANLALSGWEPNDLAQTLRYNRSRDTHAGRTVEGPHRIDLIVSHADKQQSAARCSTGEQKALLLGIVLAHADLVAMQIGKRPILLLDEVAAHLDAHRRAALFDRLGQAGGQVWMTGTDEALFADAGQSAMRLRISAGRVLQ